MLGQQVQDHPGRSGDDRRRVGRDPDLLRPDPRRGLPVQGSRHRDLASFGIVQKQGFLGELLL